MKTYGTATLRDDTWHIDAAPHVAIRLKRFFPRAQQGKTGTIRLKATDEVARDLRWFLERFPLDVTGRQALDAQADRHTADEDSFDALLSGRCQPDTFELELPPREYQRVAATLTMQARGLLLVDEMGVGKTCSAICVMSDARARPALVVAPTQVQRQWQNELARFAPKLRTHIVQKRTPYDVTRGTVGSPRSGQEDLFQPEFPDVLITTYAKLSGWRDVLAGKVRCVVFDEVQDLRHPDTAKYDAAEHIAGAAEYRLGMSGTPIYNFGEEFFNILSLLRPDALGERAEFLREWCSVAAEGKAPIKDPEAFGQYVRDAGLMLRRTRSDVKLEMPSLTRVSFDCSADEKALEEAEDAASELARIILSKESTWSEKGQASQEIDWRLRQATGIAKAPHVAAFVKMLAESGEKVLLFGWHRAVYDIWAEKLRELRPVFFTGSETPAQKERAKQSFIEGDARVLVMSLRSGTGIDGLQRVCRTAVYGELDWSDSTHEQGITRIHRPGQADPVTAYMMVSDCGSDPVVAESCGIKSAQLRGVRDLGKEPDGVFRTREMDRVRVLAERYALRSGGDRAAE